MEFIYLDHNATSPLHPEVRRALCEALDAFGNPSSQHRLGRQAAALCEEAREKVARLLGSETPEEIVFTGSGSEANNLALQGVARAQRQKLGDRRPVRILSTPIEHPSVLETLKALQQDGVEVELLRVDANGRLDLEALAKALQSPADLLSVMLANNEVGTIQPVAEAARLAHQAGALVHTDAVQAVAKIPVDVQTLGVDLLSASAHKMNGPKGVGMLYVRRGVPLHRIIHGGPQEEGRRAGTQNTPAIVGTGVAAEIARQELVREPARLARLRDRLWQGIKKSIDGVQRYGDRQHCLPGTLAVSFDGLRGEPVMLRLDMEGIGVSIGSACHGGTLEPSHVLMAMGVKRRKALGLVRMSLGLGNDEPQIDRVLEVLPGIIDTLRNVAGWSRR